MRISLVFLFLPIRNKKKLTQFHELSYWHKYMDYLLLVDVDNDDTNQNQIWSIKSTSFVLLRKVKYDFLYLLLDITYYC